MQQTQTQQLDIRAFHLVVNVSWLPAGDTVSGLISSAGLPADSSVFFYAINPSVSNSTDTIPAGTTVTTPCFRITEYYRLADANAPAPAVAATGK